nr:T9SS type A sorting domain-containing protein [Bacteroidota bacterium]
MRNLFLVFITILPFTIFGQGRNHNWLLGYDVALFDTNVTSTKAFLQFDTNSVTVNGANFKMPFGISQGNISDENGNLLLVSNGCWIADVTGDTMQNGGGLNPSPFTTDWCDNTNAIPMWHSNVILPWPDSANKYVLFHMTGNYATLNWKPTELFYSVIDMNLNNGLGGVVVGQKNLFAVQDTLVASMAACKHANGRDWWIVVFKDSTNIVYKVLLTPTGISSVTTQALNVPSHFNIGQANFSPNGKKFAYHERTFTNGNFPVTHGIRLFDFDRCTGMMSNEQIISHIDFQFSGNGLAFSSNSQYLYFTTFYNVYQLNTDTSNMQASMVNVATYDGYVSPFYPLQTNFWLMYLAANGKMYICSGNSVIDMHYIDSPDSGGMSCNVVQHGLHLPCYYFRGNVYHPNYYLGCDTSLGCPCLSANSISENGQHDFRFRVYPNPVVNNFVNIGYILPQNKSGILKLYDVNGKQLYTQGLPPWSNEQSIKLPKLANGVYNLRIESGGYFMSKNLVVMGEK